MSEQKRVQSIAKLILIENVIIKTIIIIFAFLQMANSTRLHSK